jgi:hypothetical protein
MKNIVENYKITFWLHFAPFISILLLIESTIEKKLLNYSTEY